MANEKLEVLIELFSAMENAFLTRCYEVYDLDFEETLKTALKSAENSGLKWGDFYDLHERQLGGYKQKQRCALIYNGLEAQALEKESKGAAKIGSPSNYFELGASMILGDAYSQLYKKRVTEIENMQITKKFPENKLINSKDFSKAESYFKNNLTK